MSKLTGLFAYDTVNNKPIQCATPYCNKTAFFVFDDGKALCMLHGSSN